MIFSFLYLMYQKYSTDALVLGSREHGESDRVFALFTRDFGLVRARASAVRSEKSKMRYALQVGSRSSVSLVRGTHGWRAAGAAAYVSPVSDTAWLPTFARISQLVLRLVHGEEKNEYLYEVLAEARSTLPSASRDLLPTIELVCVARVLYALGYLSAPALGTALFTHTAYEMQHLQEAATLRDDLLSSINKAISETQL